MWLRYLMSMVAQMVKASAYNAGDLGSIPGLGRPLEKEMATHSSILAWKIPWTEEPVGYSPLSHKESATAEHTHNVHARFLVFTPFCSLLSH